MDSYLPFLWHYMKTQLNNKLATSSQFLPYLAPPPERKKGTTQCFFFLGVGWGGGCGLKFGVFVSSSFFEGRNERKLHFEEPWCSLLLLLLLRDFEGPPFPFAVRCLFFSVLSGFCETGILFSRAFFFSWKGLVKRERERKSFF
jgi:hypothetical protein